LVTAEDRCIVDGDVVVVLGKDDQDEPCSAPALGATLAVSEGVEGFSVGGEGCNKTSNHSVSEPSFEKKSSFIFEA
jgi:hypothetical protein